MQNFVVNFSNTYVHFHRRQFQSPPVFHALNTKLQFPVCENVCNKLQRLIKNWRARRIGLFHSMISSVYADKKFAVSAIVLVLECRGYSIETGAR